ncbi:MAG: class I SAM-dependent methyltransferase [Gemmatimonadetes bacterium]|nr:class I SAM-dependent methyltransferase [Gemmatimonadota bacterium]
MSEDHLDQLERSWVDNADAWTAAVREQRIESRRVATDQAVLRAVLERSPTRVLDVGCGEGWLCRALADAGIDALGIDASAPLIEAARRAGGGRFEAVSYRDLIAAPGALGSFDAVVCNFALLEEDVAPLLSALRQTLRPEGALLIQTVHPWTACGEAEYSDGWRMESFSAFGGEFPRPMPWYFRTLQSWFASLQRTGFCVEEMREPVHPATARPLSLLLLAGPLRERGRFISAARATE